MPSTPKALARCRRWHKSMRVEAIERRSEEAHPDYSLEQIYERYHSSWGEPFVNSEDSGKIDGVQGEIYRDVGRTMPLNPLFVSGEGQPMLARILKAIAFCHDDVGYCQGKCKLTACA